MGPRFTSWPANQVVCEGDTLTVECGVENCSSVVMSRHFVPVGVMSLVNMRENNVVTLVCFQKSVDKDLIQFSRGSEGSWRTEMKNVHHESSGLYFVTARNAQGEEKYPVILTVTPAINLDAVTECALEDG